MTKTYFSKKWSILGYHETLIEEKEEDRGVRHGRREKCVVSTVLT